MPATVRKIHATKAEELSQLIDQAGYYNEQAKEFGSLYEETRKRIEILMPLSDKAPLNEKQGEEYEAIRDYPSQKMVDPRGLFSFNKEIFWRLVKVPVGDTEKVVPKDVFHRISSVIISDTSRLRILKKKSKAA